MDIKRAKQEIKNTVKAYLAKDSAGEYAIPTIRQRPVLLMGPPGVGKTQVMEQIAQECGIGLVAYTITHHTRQSAVGLPFIRQKTYGGTQYSVTEYTMSEIIASVYNRMEQTGCREGILFIDEINCVSETLAPTMLQFLQCKTFGNQAVPQGWIIVAAGNPPEYNRSVRDFDIVTLDRVRRIDVEPSLPVWQEYARRQRLHPAILSYLSLRPQHFYKIENDVDGLQFVTARGWEDLSAMLSVSEKLGLPVDEGVIGQYLCHAEIARDFAAYWDLFKKYRQDYGLENILAGHPAEGIFSRLLSAAFDERFSLVSLLISGLSTRFSAARTADAITDACYQQLRAYKQALSAGGTEQHTPAVTDSPVHPAALFAAQCRAFDARTAAGKGNGTLSAYQVSINEQAGVLLNGWAGSIAADADADAAFEAVRESFNQQVRRREDAVTAASDTLEHAFDFMERAFREDQEMVVFINELALGPDSAPFLAENECERFTQYSRKLLLDGGNDEISAELERNDLRRGEHSAEF
jgi:DNA polymerase III delta prime subunit